jgi:hypothetical protein
MSINISSNSRSFTMFKLPYTKYPTTHVLLNLGLGYVSITAVDDDSLVVETRNNKMRSMK